MIKQYWNIPKYIIILFENEFCTSPTKLIDTNHQHQLIDTEIWQDFPPRLEV